MDQEAEKAAQSRAEEFRSAQALEKERLQRLAYLAEQKRMDEQREFQREFQQNLDERQAYEDRQKSKNFENAVLGFIVILWWLSPWIIAFNRRHKLFTPITILTFSPVIVSIPAALMSSNIRESDLQNWIIRCLFVALWLGLLVWSTWPGLGTPKPPAPATRVRRPVQP
jgi:hypothetical protein